MAKRHGVPRTNAHPTGWDTIFQRLQELVMANSGEDEFEEIFKLVVVKIYDELFPDSRTGLQLTADASTNARRFNQLLTRAANQWPLIVDPRAKSELMDEHLTVCLRELTHHRLCDASLEVLDGAFEFLISQNAKGSKGQYFTPRNVVECCVRMLDPQPHEMIVDPACGSGGFLVHSYLHAKKHRAGKSIRNNIWGFDLDRRAIQIAKALMLITSGSDHNLFQLNTLRLPPVTSSGLDLDASDEDAPMMTLEETIRHRAGSFRGVDVILTNPPFAGDVQERSFLNAYELAVPGRRVERDVLFLERCVRILKPGGRIAIILPHNKFGAQSWAYLRSWLLAKLRVVAVVGLGRHTFLPHTHQKASVLIGVKRSKAQQHIDDEKILFMVSEKDGKDSKGQHILRSGMTTGALDMWSRVDHDLGEIVSEFNHFREQELPKWSDAC